MNGLDRRFFHNLFVHIAEEMGTTLQRTAFSPNIKERNDFSCAIFTGDGNLLAQAAHIPVHLGALPASLRAIRERFAADSDDPPAPGDVFILNDPYAGGTHLPDITLASPVFEGEDEGNALLFWLITRAHHADVGGMSPGSLPLSRELVQEGFRFPPVRLHRAGVPNQDLLDTFLANVRTPDERRGDLRAQLAAHHTGERRLREQLARHGTATLTQTATHLLDYGADLMADRIRRIPDGTYTAADAIADDGLGNGPFHIHLALTIDGDRAHLDFAGTAPACPGSLNAVEAITTSAVLYAFLCLLATETPDPPINGGCFRPITLDAPPGSIINARPPHAVAAGNVETSQRIVDIVFAALAQALPGIIPAASQGTMNNLTIGGTNPATGLPFAYYETMAGGLGARPTADGLDAVQVHMTNTLNTPAEALEHAFPFRLTRQEIADDTGGDGQHRGGHGLLREYEFLADVQITLLTTRRGSGDFPPGLRGGAPGRSGKNEVLQPAISTEWRDVGPHAHLHLQPGDRLRVTTPGGGGWGAKRN